ncbi:hypothetical protein SB6095_04608 [Klebsiella quasivariicola]|nr:hypothetical protein SB6095_04608 [Klebsiella quasivariicola]
MAKNDFKPFATAANANVMSQADWEGLPALLSGFTSGKAASAEVNKAIRQASFIAAALAQYTANKSGLDVLDDGDLNGFITKMSAAFGKDFQALDATLTALAGLATGANKLPYFTGNDTAAQTDLTSVGRDIIGKNTIADILTYLGLAGGLGANTIGRLIGVKVIITSQNYTPTTGTKNIIVEAISGGGGSLSGSTPTGQTGGSQAGYHGQYNKSLYQVSNLSFPVTVTVGAGGGADTWGGATYFGPYMSLDGGKAADAVLSSSGPGVAGNAYRLTGYKNITTGLQLASSLGETVSNQIIQVTTGTACGFSAPNSPFPGGWQGRGGDGTYAPSGSTYTGKAGAPGIVVVWEYA